MHDLSPGRLGDPPMIAEKSPTDEARRTDRLTDRAAKATIAA